MGGLRVGLECFQIAIRSSNLITSLLIFLFQNKLFEPRSAIHCIFSNSPSSSKSGFFAADGWAKAEAEEGDESC